jgi:MFS family permease
MGFAIFGVQLGPVVGAVARGVGQEFAFSTTVVFGLALGVWAWTMPVRRAEGETLATPGEALRSRAMLAGMWLTALPAAAFGVLDVLAPLRLDALGASALALGATFFAAAGVEAVVTPAVGRYTDRAGAQTVIRGGLAATVAGLVVLQLPDTPFALAVVVIAISGLLGVLWVPAMGLLTGGAERIGLDHGFAFAYFNLAWAAGFSLGSVAGGSLAEITRDAVPYTAVAGLYAASAVVALLVTRTRLHEASEPARP